MKLLSLVVCPGDYLVLMNDDRTYRDIAVFLGNFRGHNSGSHKLLILLISLSARTHFLHR